MTHLSLSPALPPSRPGPVAVTLTQFPDASLFIGQSVCFQPLHPDSTTSSLQMSSLPWGNTSHSEPCGPRLHTGLVSETGHPCVLSLLLLPRVTGEAPVPSPSLTSSLSLMVPEKGRSCLGTEEGTQAQGTHSSEDSSKTLGGLLSSYLLGVCWSGEAVRKGEC